VDHVDPMTKDPMAVKHNAIWAWSMKRREAELAKCQVLCVECHLSKSAQERKVIGLQHGTEIMFERSCRCAVCVQWFRVASARVIPSVLNA